MFILAVVALIFGYALIYTGTVNMKNGGQGPGLWEAMGWNLPSADTTAVTPQSTTQGPTFQQV